MIRFNEALGWSPGDEITVVLNGRNTHVYTLLSRGAVLPLQDCIAIIPSPGPKPVKPGQW